MWYAAEDDQEGVMDNLLEALKTGSAFNVNRERKEGRRRAPRAAGGLMISWSIVADCINLIVLLIYTVYSFVADYGGVIFVLRPELYNSLSVISFLFATAVSSRKGLKCPK